MSNKRDIKHKTHTAEMKINSLFTEYILFS